MRRIVERLRGQDRASGCGRRVRLLRPVSWAASYIAKLGSGARVRFRPHGHSMTPRIESGQLCTVAPVDVSSLAVGDVVLCRVHGCEYLHIVKAIEGSRFQIGNNHGRINGWVSSDAIFGKLEKVEP